jgi:hypothetical protein
VLPYLTTPYKCRGVAPSISPSTLCLAPHREEATRRFLILQHPGLPPPPTGTVMCSLHLRSEGDSCLGKVRLPVRKAWILRSWQRKVGTA